MPVLAAFILPHPPLIIPQIGKGREAAIEKTIAAYETVGKRIESLAPDTIVFITPHAPSYSDYIHVSGGLIAEGSFSAFGAPEAAFGVMYEKKLVQDITKLCEEISLPAGNQGGDTPEEQALDHGMMIPLHFIHKYFQDFRCIRVSVSSLPLPEHYVLGEVIAQCCNQFYRNIVVIASGDLSHKLKEDGPYGFSPSGPVFDQKIQDMITSANFLELFRLDESLCAEAAECGLRPMAVMAGMLDKKSVRSELLSYECPFGVGYAVGSFEVLGDDENRGFLEILDSVAELPSNASPDNSPEASQPSKESLPAPGIHVQIARIARIALETFVLENELADLPDDLPTALLTQRAGVFVSLKKQGLLRGCIGTLAPVQENIALEITANAISAGTKDPRFPPITPAELSQITYSVDVLGPAEKIDSPAQLDAQRYGVIVTSGRRRGLLLPNLEGVDTVDAQLAIALEKGGILPTEVYGLERFEVVRYT